MTLEGTPIMKIGGPRQGPDRFCHNHFRGLAPTATVGPPLQGSAFFDGSGFHVKSMDIMTLRMDMVRTEKIKSLLAQSRSSVEAQHGRHCQEAVTGVTSEG
jgi:hypothetical protein